MDNFFFLLVATEQIPFLMLSRYCYFAIDRQRRGSAWLAGVYLCGFRAASKFCPAKFNNYSPPSLSNLHDIFQRPSSFNLTIYAETYLSRASPPSL